MNMLSEAGPSHYASSTLPPSLSVDADTRRPAFTYASKAIVDESWTQVEAFPKDEEDDASDYETEEEVCYVTLDFGNEIPVDALKQADAFQLTNLNSAEPFARIGTHILRGRHEKLLGSELLFQQELAEAEANKAASIEHIGTTQDRISFERLTLAPKISSTTALINGQKGLRQEHNATSFLLTTGRQNPARASATGKSRGGRGGTAGRKKATSADGDEDGDEVGGGGAPRPRGRGRGRGGRGGARAPTATPAVEGEGSAPPAPTRGRPRGRPRGSRARAGRGRGAGRATSSVGPEDGEGGSRIEEGQSQLFAGDGEGDAAGSADGQAGSNQNMQDLPDIEEF